MGPLRHEQFWKLEAPCEHCGKPYFRVIRTQMFCCKECHIGSHRPEFDASERICKLCEQVFKPKTGGQKFCQKSCQKTWSSQRVAYRGAASRHLGSTGQWPELQKLLNQQDCQCPYTGERLWVMPKENQNAQLDHIVAKARGGSINDINNLQWVRADINKAKGTQSDAQYRKQCCEVADYTRSTQSMPEYTI